MSNTKRAQPSNRGFTQHKATLASHFSLCSNNARRAARRSCILHFTRNTLNRTLHQFEFDPLHIRTSREEKAVKHLFNIMKDHNNATIQEMLDASNVYCYRNGQDWSSDSDEEEDDSKIEELLESGRAHFPIVLCCLRVVNVHYFGDHIITAVPRLESDILVFGMTQTCAVDLATYTKAIYKIERVMKICTHGLYKSHVYTKTREC